MRTTATWDTSVSVWMMEERFSLGGQQMADLVGLNISQWRDQYWLPYHNEMMGWIFAHDPAMHILAPTTGGIPFPDPNWVTGEARNAFAFGFGWGNQGIQKSDITNWALGRSTEGDWAANAVFYSPFVPIEVQTVGLSDAAGNLAGTSTQALTGPLPPLVNFSLARGATIFEIYTDDWFLALVPNYLNDLNQTNAMYGEAYASSFLNAYTITGFYTAPSISGVYNITAISIADPTAVDSAIVTVNATASSGTAERLVSMVGLLSLPFLFVLAI